MKSYHSSSNRPAEVKHFTEYIAETWINNIAWRPSGWSVYQMAVRTNNDIEGWPFRAKHLIKDDFSNERNTTE